MIFSSLQISAQNFSSTQSAGQIPSENHLYLNDIKPQILFNPARGVNADQSFFYVNKSSRYTSYPFFYFDGGTDYRFGEYDLQHVINYEKSKSDSRVPTTLSADWFIKSENPNKFSYLFQFEQLSTIENEEAEAYLDQKTIQQDYGYFRTQNLKGNTIQKNHSVQAKFSAIYGQKNDGQSFSILAGVKSGEITEKNRYASSIITRYANLTRYFNTCGIDQKRGNDNRVIWLGFQSSSASETSDFTVSFVVNKEKNNGFMNSTFFSASGDSVFNSNLWQINENRQSGDKLVNVDNTPIHFNISAFYSKRLTWITNDDNIYASLSLSRTKNDSKHDFTTHSFYKNPNEPAVISSQKFDNFLDDSYTSFLSAKTGYIVRHSKDDVFLLTG